jgi:hypothetical protein
MSHALLGPSSAKQWMTCTPSARFGERFPDQGSDYANEGSFAHLMAEHYINYRLGYIPMVAFNQGYHDFRKNKFYSEEMANHVSVFADWVKSNVRQGDSVFLEQTLMMNKWIPEGYGTGDVIIVNDDYIHVIDLKYGKGVRVEAEDNPQLKCYGLGAAQTYRMLYDFSKVYVTIYQPRIEEGITHWEYDLKDLMKWADEELTPAAEKAWHGEGQFVPGDHCRFCKGKAHCETRMQYAAGEAFLLDEPSEVMVMKPNQLSEQDMERWVKYAGPLIKWLGDLQKYALKTALEGRQWPGLKLVEGRSNRVYSDKLSVMKALKQSDYTGFMKEPSLIGVGAMEKLLGAKGFRTYVEPYIIKPAGKPALVGEDDKRPALDATLAAQAAFADEDEED